MTTEILKDEIMSNEELDNVVGGTTSELANDIKFLHALGLMDHHYDADYCSSHMGQVQNEINAAIKGLRSAHGASGFSVSASADGANAYSVSNWRVQGCPRDVMYKMICEGAGKPDFDYSRFL